MSESDCEIHFDSSKYGSMKNIHGQFYPVDTKLIKIVAWQLMIWLFVRPGIETISELFPS